MGRFVRPFDLSGNITRLKRWMFSLGSMGHLVGLFGISHVSQVLRWKTQETESNWALWWRLKGYSSVLGIDTRYPVFTRRVWRVDVVYLRVGDRVAGNGQIWSRSSAHIAKFVC
jgi:hypothetical protein